MREYLLIFAVAAAITYVSTPGVRWLAIRVGAITPVRARDVHSTPVPRLGGVAMLLGFLAAVAVAGQLSHLRCIVYSCPGNPSLEIRGIVLGAVIMCLVGALDDVRELDWVTKLAGQILAAGVMAKFGVQLLGLPLFGVTILPREVLIALTVLIVLVSTNAVNFIDGLDGLAAGIVGIAASAFFLFSYLLLDRPNGEASVFTTAAFVTAALAGCCAGFLPHNFHPARLFMGDAGALLLGLLLASATISMVGGVDPGVEFTNRTEAASYLPVIVPVAVLGLPLLDMTLAVIRRTRAGQKPWQADAHHLQHRMMRIGHTHVRAVLILYLWAAIVAFGAVAFAFVDSIGLVAVLVAAMVLALVLTRRLPKWIDKRGL